MTCTMPRRTISDGRRRWMDAPAELDRALGHVAALGAEQTGDGLERGGLAGAVGPEEGDDAPLGDAQRDALQHEDHVVVDDLDVVDRQQRAARRCPSRPARYFSLEQSRWCSSASCLPPPPPPPASDGRRRASARSSRRRRSTSCRPTAGRGPGRCPRGPRSVTLSGRMHALHAELLESLLGHVEVLQAPAHLLAGRRALAVLLHGRADGLDVEHGVDDGAVVEDLADAPLVRRRPCPCRRRA